ncbi:MAG: hypothetical protein V7603_6412 [Micromonosporaceae bacterium]|jgi:WXG100 family type VII secretion target
MVANAGSDLQVYGAAMPHIAANIRTAAKNLLSQLDDLDAELTRVTARWDGGSKNAYFTQKQVWSESAAALQRILHVAGDTVEQAWTDSQHTDQTIARSFTG